MSQHDSTPQRQKPASLENAAALLTMYRRAGFTARIVGDGVVLEHADPQLTREAHRTVERYGAVMAMIVRQEAMAQGIAP